MAIVADHTIVDRFDDIPAYYINEVKKMSLHVPGESHAYAYMTGLNRLEISYPTYAVNFTSSGTPEAYTTSHLRINMASWGDYDTPTGWIFQDYGEEDWWTNAAAIAQTKTFLSYANSIGRTIGALGFGWCADLYYGGHISTTADPVYGCRWYGSSKGSPSGDQEWGLDDGDNTICGNTVNLDDYLTATQSYIDYCTANSIATKVFFTTGPVDGPWGVHVGNYTPEGGYNAYLKHERIRDYVDAGATRYLFDYADILSFDNDGTPGTDSWNGHTFPMGTYNNCGTEQTGHITYVGAERLAKAMWWMLARMAGWDGGSTPIVAPTVTTTAISAITSSTAASGGNVSSDGGATVTARGVCWGTATNPTIALTTKTSNGTGTGSFTSSITGLTAGTTYHVRAYATNSVGTGYGEDRAFTTTSVTAYYVATSGSDSNPGTQALPWQTISKVNSYFSAGSFAPGDMIYFRRGDTFVGTLTISESGTSGSRITIGAYGTGANPKISGFVTLSGWTNYGGGIYSKVVSCPSTPTMVTFDGVNTPMGRYPNTGTWNTVQSSASRYSLTDNVNLNSAVTNWTGAEVVIKVDLYSINHFPITGHSGGTLTYTQSTTNDIQTNYGYFIQNDLRTVTAYREWYYNPSTSTFYMYFGAEAPTSHVVKIGSIATGVNITGYGYITFDGLDFEGFNNSAFYLGASPYITIQNCNFNFLGYDAVDGYTSSGSANIAPGLVFTYNTVSDVGANGIHVNQAFTTMTISHNTFNNLGVIAGQGYQRWIDNHSAIVFGARANDNINTVVEYNTITNAGYCGIYWYGDRATIRYNFINYFSTLLDDGGAIYTFDNIATVRTGTVTYNICLNGLGNTEGRPTSSVYSYGLYTDGSTVGIDLTHNTVAYVSHAGYLNNSNINGSLEDNTFYSCQNGIWMATTNSIDGMTILRNIMFARLSTQYTAMFYFTGNPLASTTLDYNYYTRPISETTTIYHPASTTITLATWKTQTGDDVYSATAGRTVTSSVEDAQIHFRYNATTSNKVYALSATMYSVNGTSYGVGNTVTLLPYTSIILLGAGTVTEVTGGPTAPTITTIAASSITTTTATSGGNSISDGGASITAKGVCWSTIINPTVSDSHTSDGTGVSSFTSNLTGLLPSTLYHIRAYATNSVNTSYGSDLTFTTLSTPEGSPDEVFTTASGTVSVLNYISFESCQKLIQPATGGIITLTFTLFETELNYDFVRVYDGSTTSATLLGTYSGSSLPPTLVSTGSSMLIVFTSDSGINFAGWSANYTSAAPPSGSTYYVKTYATGGRDEIGRDGLSVANAWATPAYAAGRVSAGDYTIYIESGSYTDNERVNLALGVKLLGNNITRPEITTSYPASGDDGYIRAYSSSNIDGNNTISYININGNNLTSRRAIYAENRNNVIVHHCNISNFLVGGIYFESEDAWNAEPSSYIYDCEVYNCNITNCSDREDPSGITYEHEGLLRATGCHDLLVYNNVFTNNQRTAGNNGNILTLTFQRGSKFHDNTYYRLDNEGGNWAFYCELFHPRGGMEVYNETFIGGGTWDMGASPMVNGCYITPGYGYTYALSIHDNSFNTSTGAQLSGRNGTEPNGKHHIAIDIEGPLDDVIIYNNHIRNYAIGISMVTGEVARTYAQNRVYIYNNLIENVGYTVYAYTYGIFLNDEPNYPYINTKDNIHVWNNTIHGGSGFNYEGIICHWRGNITNSSIKNNVIYDFDQEAVKVSRQTDGTQALNLTDFDIVYNNFYSCGTTITEENITSKTSCDFTTGNQSTATDPGLNTDWTIISPSSAVYHAGTPVGLTIAYNDIAWNDPPSIGAYEYNIAMIIHYIDPSGSDTTGDGSITNPWATLYKACTSVSEAGDIIHINAGDYYGSTQCPLAANVSIEGVGDTSHIISNLPNGAENGGYILLSSGTNTSQHISNIKLDGNNLSGYRAIGIYNRSNVSIYNCTIVDFNTEGVRFYGSTGTNNSFYNNTLINCGGQPNHTSNLYIGGQTDFQCYGNTITQTARATALNGNCISGYEASYGMKIYNNIITATPYLNDSIWKFAVELWLQQGLEMYGNTIKGEVNMGKDVNYGTYSYGIYFHDNTVGWDDPIAYSTNGLQLEQTAQGVIIAYNTFKNLDQPIHFCQYNYSDDYVEDVWIYTNLIYNCGLSSTNSYGWGIRFESGGGNYPPRYYDNINIWNNTIVAYSSYPASWGIELPTHALETNTMNIDIKNNIILGFKNYCIYGITRDSGHTTMIDYLTITYNVVFHNGGSNDVYFSFTPTNYSNDGGIKSDPLVAYSPTNLHLSSTSSSAYHAGISVTFPYNLGDYDHVAFNIPPSIGAYEYYAGYPLYMPTVTTSTPVTGIHQTSASCGGNVISDGGATVTDRGVCWSTAENPTIADSKTSDGTGVGSFTSSITGLTEDTTYYVRAFATNSVDTGYGSQVSFRTLVLSGDIVIVDALHVHFYVI